MRTLREVQADSVTISDRSPAAGALLAVPPLAALAFVTVAEGFPRPDPMFALLCSAGVMVALVVAALPRKRRYAITASAKLVFGTVDEGEEGPYCVALSDDRRRVTLLEHLDPGVVIRDVERIVRETGIRVEAAWGVPSDCFETRSSGRVVELVPGRFQGPVSPTQIAVTRALIGAGLFVLVVLSWTALHARTISALSILLPVGSVGLVFAIGAWFASRRSIVVIDEHGVRAAESVLGRVRNSFEIQKSELSSAHVLGHEGRMPSHLLFATTRGSRVIALAGDASEIAARHVQNSQRSAVHGEVYATNSSVEQSLEVRQ